jgi:hypothetical protein
MIQAETGSDVLLTLALKDGSVGESPTAQVLDDAGVAIAGSPFALVDRGDGLYQATFAAPAVGDYSVLFETTGFETVSEQLRVRAPVADQVLDEALSGHASAGSVGEALLAAAGHAGLHAVLDGGDGAPSIPHDLNNQLTAARLRIFGDKAAADAATLGAADGADGELLRLFVDAATYNAGSLSAVPTVLAAIRRTSA